MCTEFCLSNWHNGSQTLGPIKHWAARLASNVCAILSNNVNRKQIVTSTRSVLRQTTLFLPRTYNYSCSTLDFFFFFRGNLHFVVPFRRFPREIIRFTFPRRKPAATDFHYPALIRCKRWLSCAKLCQDNVGSSCRGIVSARRPVAYGASAVCVCVYVCLFVCVCVCVRVCVWFMHVS